MRAHRNEISRDHYVLKPRRLRQWAVRSVILVVVLAFLVHWRLSVRAERKFMESVAKLARQGEPLSPAHYREAAAKVPDSDNAARATEAAALFIVRDYADEVLQTEFRLPLTQRETCLLDAHVRANQEPVRLLQRARGRTRAAMHLPWDWARPTVVISSGSGLSDLETLLEARAFLSHQNGDDHDALERIRDLLLIGRVLSQLPERSGPFGSCAALTAIAIAPEFRTGSESSSTGTDTPAPTALLAQVIREFLDESQAKQEMQNYLRVRRVELIETFTMLANGKLGMDDLASYCRCTRPSANGYFFKPFIMSDALLVLEEATAAIQTIEEPSLPLFRSAAPGWIRQRKAMRWYAMILAPDYDRLARQHYTSLASRRLAATAMAIRWFQCDHAGQFPTSLEELVPAYLPSVPLDPLATRDRPLTYVPDPTHPRVYSIGVDGRDDGGLSRALDPSEVFSSYDADLIVNLRRQPRPPPRDLGAEYEEFIQEMSKEVP